MTINTIIYAVNRTGYTRTPVDFDTNLLEYKKNLTQK